MEIWLWIVNGVVHPFIIHYIEGRFMIKTNAICDHCHQSLPKQSPFFILRKSGDHTTINRVTWDNTYVLDSGRHLHRECLTKEVGDI